MSESDNLQSKCKRLSKLWLGKWARLPQDQCACRPGWNSSKHLRTRSIVGSQYCCYNKPAWSRHASTIQDSSIAWLTVLSALQWKTYCCLWKLPCRCVTGVVKVWCMHTKWCCAADSSVSSAVLLLLLLLLLFLLLFAVLTCRTVLLCSPGHLGLLQSWLSFPLHWVRWDV